MFKTRRKSGDDADSRNKYAAKLAADALAASRAANSRSAGSTGTDHISISRSDGLNHDLISVFANNNMANVIKESTEMSEAKAYQGDEDAEEHNRISISRSDGITHDLIRVFKTSDGADTTQQGSPPTLPPPAPTPPCKGRSISLSIKEFAKMATGSFRTNSTTQLPTTADSAAVVTSPATTSVSLNSTPFFAPKTVRIVHMSDTHNFLDKMRRSQFLPHGDILVHTGSFTSRGTEEEYAQFNGWLGSLTDLYHYRIVCLGSRDVKIFGNDWDVMKRMLSNATHVLCHTEVTVLGIRFYGSPWHWGHKTNYTIRPGAPTSTSGRFEDIPAGVHVLLTHGPAFHRLDATTAAEVKEHWGSRDLLEHLRRVKPGLHLHGHVKDSRGVLPAFANSPLTVNSAMVDKDLTVMYCAPHVIKASQTMSDSVKNVINWTFALDNLDG